MRNRPFLLALTLLTTIFILHDAALAQAGKSGLSFLKLGISGHGVAMGEAMSAHASGAAATFYNPAGILLPPLADRTSQIMVMHKEWIQDTRMEFLGATVNLSESDAIGLSVNSTTVADIEVRTRPGTPEATFTARNYAVGATYARAFSDELTVGITGKFLFEKILVDEASGIAIDLGAQYRTSMENLTVGLTLANLGAMSSLRDEKTTLPSLLRIGPAYSFDLPDVDATVALAADYLNVFPEGKSYVNVGGEFFFSRTIAGRIGYQFGSEGRGLATGIGVSYGLLNLDYAYVPLSEDLGNTHTISLSLNL
ncbi:MAG: PorV/PorQ family protein [Bacteroidetes bacterium]|nr:PorV/PorQ family protein [Bacteroidota bacterium]